MALDESPGPGQPAGNGEATLFSSRAENWNSAEIIPIDENSDQRVAHAGDTVTEPPETTAPALPLPDLSVVPDFSQLRMPEPEPAAMAASAGNVQPIAPVATEAALTREEMSEVLRAAGWPEEAILAALNVSWCESRWNPAARGDQGRAIGLFQLHGPGVGWGGGDGWFSHFGVPWEQGLDALVNAQVALQVWQRSGWQPWSCSP